MNWLIIVILIALAFFFLRMKHTRHKIFMVFVILLLLFVYLTSSRVLTGQSINWKSIAGIETATKLYFSWLGSVFDNFKTVAGNAMKMDWKLNNKTASAG